tara:strand:- start:3793 stop:6471 length:2679 start_codon:yes stop_codon:yes gene_type:complete
LDLKATPKSDNSSSSKGKSSHKTEKVLVLAALLLLLFAGGALYFDDWLWSGMRNRSGSIGMIVSQSGDVRLKFDEEVTWQKAMKGQALQYNDSVFAGDNSSADLKLGESQLTVTQNSLVVLRREMDANFLNLNFGTVFGKVAKNEKVYIDTGASKPTLLKTNSKAQIVLKKDGDKTTLQVVKGTAEVEINGEVKSLGENSQLELPKDVKKVADVKVEKLDLQFVDPSPEGTLYFKDPQSLRFKWIYGGAQQVSQSQKFNLEFSKTSNFDRPLRRTVVGKTSVDMSVSKSRQLYYRVRGNEGEVSAIQSFNLIIMEPPRILAPLEAEIFKTEYRKDHPTLFKVRGDSAFPKTWAQLSGDPEFKTVLANDSFDQTSWLKDLPPGQYFLRVRSDYGEGRLSDWSKPRSFKVKEDLKMITAPEPQLAREVIIQNLAYPPYLYGASDEETRSFLWEKGFLRDYFADLKPFYDQINIDLGDGRVLRQQDASFPKGKIYPSSVGYKYQLHKAGKLPSRWSAQEKLKITLEPPKENLVEVVPEKMKKGGKIPVRVGFTPVLFAKDYEFQVATNSGYRRPTVVKGKEPERNLKLSVNQDYYWRVRALDGKGKPISGFSKSRRISAKEIAQQMRLAQKKAEVKRKLASEEKAKPESKEDLKKLTQEFKQRFATFWSWIGSGMSYVNYKQVNELGTLDSESRNDNLGQYFEIGYASQSGWGGVLSYKIIPGEIVVDNASLDKDTYVWQMMALEGLMLKWAPFKIFGMPLLYGPRIGVQSHTVPFVYLNESDSLELKQNEMMTLSAGLMGEIPKGRWRFQSYMRYQFPFSSKSSGAASFEVKPTFAFDGLLGSTYYLSQNFKVGAFWYGQWHYYNFVYSTNSFSNKGQDSLFNSTLDLRLGFDF